MDNLLEGFQKKLIDLSTGNRHLFRKSLNKTHHLDLTQFDYELGKSSFELFRQMLESEKGVPFCSSSPTRDSDSQELSVRVSQLLRTQRLMREETGHGRKYITWPWVSGKADADRWIHAPLLYWPVTIEQKSGYWIFKLDDAPEINEAVRLLLKTAGKWDNLSENENLQELPESFRDIDQYRIDLYNWLKSQGVMVDFTSRIFENKLSPWQKIDTKEVDFPLKLISSAVLGVFQPLGGYLAHDLRLWQNQNKFKDFDSFVHTSFFKESTNKVLESSILTPVRLDDSQEKCFKSIRSGKSIVVQGPPGSGKSQLIAALATDYMARGKKVLIVAQKRVALEVVASRMRQLGIGDFVTILTDHTQDRKSLYRQLLKQIASIPHYQKENNTYQNIALERDFASVSKQIDQLEVNFTSFKEKLYLIEEAGMAAKELYLQDLDLENIVSAKLFIPRFTLNQWNKCKLTLQKWWSYREHFLTLPVGISELLVNQNSVSIHSIWKSLGDFRQSWGLFKDRYSIKSFCFTSEEVFANTDRSIFKNSYLKEAELLFDSNLLGIAEEYCLFYHKTKTSQTLGPILDLNFDLHPQTIKALKRAVDAYDSWWRKVVYKRSYEYKGLKVLFGKESLRHKDQIVVILKHLEIGYQLYENLRKSGLQIKDKYTPQLLSSALYEILEIKNQLKKLLISVGQQQIPEHWESWFQSSLEIEIEYHRLLKYIDQDIFKYYLDRNNEFEAATDFINQNSEDLIEYQEVLSSLLQVHLQFPEFLVKIRETTKDEAQFLHKVWSALAISWIEYLEEKHPELKKPGTLTFKNTIESIQNLVLEKERLALQLLLIRLKERTYTALEYNRLKNRISYKELSRQVQKKKQIWPIRKLIEQFSEEIFDLIPCWLMSPEAVSTAIPLESIFDLILIDESSQLFAERAIPVLFRGKQLMVCGDHQQLSPFDLYSVRYEEESDEEPDLHSVSLLDLMEQHLETFMLHGHYRSKFPELITFSNQHFYDRRLRSLIDYESFASNTSAIIAERVQGVWENQRNSAEAKKALDLFVQFQSQGYSTGIITFNYAQQQLILNKMEEQNVVLNPFSFVKNLENVQGDEADVIIISPAYAPDVKGKFSLNFGLLSREGGPNRLNVAITRSRIKMHVLYSFDPGVLINAQTTHPAAGLLGEFIHFALQTTTQGFNRSVLYQNPPGSLASRWMKEYEESISCDFVDVINLKANTAIITDDDRFFGSSSMKQWFGWQAHGLRAYGWKPVYEFSRSWFRTRLITR